MQLGISVTIGFYLLETALLLAIVGVGAFVYRQERGMTWQARLQRAQRPWEERRSPVMFYCIGGMYILFAIAYTAFFLGAKANAFHAFLGLGVGFAVLGAVNLYQGRRLAKRRRSYPAVATPRE